MAVGGHFVKKYQIESDEKAYALHNNETCTDQLHI